MFQPKFVLILVNVMGFIFFIFLPALQAFGGSSHVKKQKIIDTKAHAINHYCILGERKRLLYLKLGVYDVKFYL